MKDVWAREGDIVEEKKITQGKGQERDNRKVKDENLLWQGNHVENKKGNRKGKDEKGGLEDGWDPAVIVKRRQSRNDWILKPMIRRNRATYGTK